MIGMMLVVLTLHGCRNSPPKFGGLLPRVVTLELQKSGAQVFLSAAIRLQTFGVILPRRQDIWAPKKRNATVPVRGITPPIMQSRKWRNARPCPRPSGLRAVLWLFTLLPAPSLVNRNLRHGSPNKLETELEMLKAKSGVKADFKVVWLPRPDLKKEGEVVGRTIFVYSQNMDEALETLEHEFVDFVVSGAVEPYLKVVNALLSAISEQAYDKKEEVVEALLKLLSDRPPS